MSLGSEGSAGVGGSNSNGSHHGRDARACGKGPQSSGDLDTGSKGSGSNEASNAGSTARKPAGGGIIDRADRGPGGHLGGVSVTGHDGQSQREYRSGNSGAC